ncbi:MAG: S1/P1 nuclease [Muribaculum sp.]|nr:S1/P1 nuclease [Muribaculum sp.]
MSRFYISILSLFTALTMFGWGQKGHDTTAAIAERHLTPEAKAAVDSILDGRSIIYWSNWLDNASHTPEYAYTKTWHYRNIDADQTWDSAPLNPAGDVVSAINEQLAALATPDRPIEETRLSLIILVHLMGDLHQPMHIGHASDLGGNRWNVKYFGRNTPLHSVWDTNLVESGHKWSYSEYADQIDRVNAEEQAAIIAGTPDDWGRQTYEICTHVYNTTPVDANLSYDYVAAWTPTVENQFLRGGLRLAALLNSIYNK